LTNFAAHVEGLTEREGAFHLGADHLLRLDPLVGGVPHVHVGRLVGRLARRVGCGRNLLLHPEEHALVVVAPRTRCVIADDPSRRESGGLRGNEDDVFDRAVAAETRRHVGKADEHVIALPHLLDLEPFEHRDRGPAFVPREPVVILRVVVERDDASGLGVEDEEAVAVLHRGVHGVRAGHLSC
jgi:hypothetical protein